MRIKREAQVVGARLIFPAAAVALISSSSALAKWPVFPCTFLRLTHVPCPGCGVTRCLAAIGQLHPGDALRWNPLAFCVVLAAFLQPLLAENHRLKTAIFSRPAALGLFALVAVNWLYLCFTLPR
ncbi:MAG: hypothetical protein QOD99_2317 [Chthoniobacter sp.]|jgi:hypothetical protein|nr:hypothetical protein [Chthoniobacter sp.]